MEMKEIKKYYDGLTKEELKQRLIEAGFEVEDGEGKIIFTEQKDILNEYCRDKCPNRYSKCFCQIVDTKNDLCIVEDYQKYLSSID